MDRLVVLQIGQINTRTPANEGWHFIDAQDKCSPRQKAADEFSPPQSCSVAYNRDCPSSGGCVISALVNNTQILRQCLDDNDVSIECSNALKFLVHFMGDITQPLHCSAKSRGGNQIEVKFGNRRRNFHSVLSRCSLLMVVLGYIYSG